MKKTGNKSPAFIVSYRTETPLTDKNALMKEVTDLSVYVYYFHLPEKIKNDKNAAVGILAFKDIPPAEKFTKKISEIEAFLKSSAVDPHRLKAFQDFNRKKYVIAISSFEKIESKVPHDYAQIANAYLLLRQTEESRKWLEEGMKRYPKDLMLLNNLAMTTLFKGTFFFDEKYEYNPEEMEKAKKILSQALELNTGYWLTKANMAVLETTLQHFDAAEKLYLEALKLSDHYPELSYQVAVFYHEQKKYDQAKTHYQNALKKLKEVRSPAATSKVKEIEKKLKLTQGKKPLS